MPCTIDRCGDGAVCEHIPHDELCGPSEFCLAGPGCLPRPPDRCSEDADCVVGPACVGEWRCVFEFGCQFVGILDCDDRDGCTVDRCDDAVGCVNLPRDIDGDTHVDAACGGDDCDDGDRARRPSAEERCNGVDDDCNGACDEAFACCAGRTADCSTLGWHAGTARCADNCSGWSTSGCTNCGNLRRDAGEECDGADLGSQDCVSIGRGFGGGTLRCAASCTFDVSGCTRCGNGTIDPGEQCDGAALGGHDCTTIGGGFAGGSLGCTPACAFDTSQCTRPFDPSGVYLLTPAPSYRCAYFFGVYLVNFTIPSLTFTDSGTVLSVVGAPCPVPQPMTGPSARTTRNINVSCTYVGSCNETYSLTGSFVTDDRWTGTFRATYSGSCLDCTNQSWSVSGQR